MVTEMAAQFNQDGYLVVDDIFPVSVVDSVYDRAVQTFDEVLNIVDENHLEFGVGIKNGFKEIVQRHQNRYEMAYKMDDPCFDFVLKCTALRQLVGAILDCDDFIIANRSLVVSKPGCADQAWHSDGPHVSTTSDLPCHVFNAFIPLVDVTLCNGPTEFRPGSQFYTRDLAKSMLVAKLKKQLRPVHAPEVRKGSILLFDYRVLHRGLANLSETIRPILVFTFAKPWYKDMLNFPRRSVLTEAAVKNHSDVAVNEDSGADKSDST